jgi:hypothetical protein
MSTGSYIPANDLLLRTLQEIRQSTAFKANNTVAENAVSSLMSLEQELQTYVSSSASAAQASQAQSSFVPGLTSSSVQASSRAAAGLANIVRAQIEYLLAIGSYADATSLVTATLQQLRNSTAFKAGDSTVIEIVAQFTALNIKTVSENPTTTASAAAASSAQTAAATGLASKNVTTSSNAATSMSNAITSQVQYLIAIGEYSAAISLLTKTLEQLRSSTAFMSGDPATVAIVSAFTQQIRDANARTYTSTGAQAASAATASSANAAQLAGLTNSSVSISSSSAVALVSLITSQANYLIATGDYAAAEALVTSTLQQLRSSTAFKAGDPTVLSLITTLNSLANNSVQWNPNTTASAAIASAALSTSVSSLSSSVQISSNAATNIFNTVSAQIEYLTATGDYSAAIALLTSTLAQLRNSTAFLANDPNTLMIVEGLTQLNNRAASLNPNTTASAAAASAATVSNTAALTSTNITISSNAAAALGATVQGQLDFLFSTGNYNAADSLLESTLTAIRASTAFMAGDSATVALVNKLTQLEIKVDSLKPGAAASAAAASAAIATSVAALTSSNVSGSVAAATTLGANIISQVNALLIIGSYFAAADLLINTLQELRGSTAFKAGDPTVIALVNQLAILQQKAVTNNPTTTASAATASAANSAATTGLSSTNVATSSTAAVTLGNNVLVQLQQLLGIGDYDRAMALSTSTLQNIRASSAFLAGDPATVAMVATLTALAQSAISNNPAAAASAAAASAAVTNSVATLSSSSVASSASAAILLSNTIFTDATNLLSLGSYSSAAAKLLAAMTQIRDSTAFKAGEPSVTAAVNRLATLYQQVVQINPNASASAAAASSAQSAAASGLSSTNVQTSSTSAATLAATIQSQIDFLTSTGNNGGAIALIGPTLVSLRASTAFLAGDSATVALVNKLTQLQLTLLANNPSVTASAAAASAAIASNVSALSSSNVTTSATAAGNLGQTVLNLVNTYISVGSYSSAVALLSVTLQELRDSTAFKAGDSSVIALVNQLVALQQNSVSSNPAAAASAAAASAAQSAAVATLSSTDLAVSSRAVTTLVSSIVNNIQAIIDVGASGSTQEAKTLAVTTLQQIRASPAFLAGDPAAVAAVNQLTTLLNTIITKDSTTTASAAVASAAMAADVAGLSSTSLLTSNAAAIDLGNITLAQAQTLLATGSYAEAQTAITSAMKNIRNSTAFKAGEPAVLAMYQRLVTFYQQILQSNPASTASAAAAATATSTAAAALKNTDVATSATAVATIVKATEAQVAYFLSIGDYASANSLLQTTIAQIRNSTAAIASDPGTAANIAKLTASLETVTSSNPATTASAAAESGAKAGLQQSLANTDVQISAAAAASLVTLLNANVAYNVSLGNFAFAQSSIATAIQQIMTSSAYAASDPATLALVATLQNKMLDVANQNPASLTAENRASAAQSYYISALQGTDLPASIQASRNLTASVTTSVNSLIETGAYSVASQLINQTLQAIYFSTAYLSGDPATLQSVKSLTALLQTANSKLPPSIATASAAAASAAQVGYMSNLQNTDSNISAQACLSLGISVIGTVNTLLSLGSNQVAYNILKGIISSISTSTAVSSGNPQVLSLLKTLTALQSSIPQPQQSTEPQPTQATEPQPTQATEPQPTQATAPPPAENLFSLSENSEKGYGYGNGYGYGYGKGGGSKKVKKAKKGGNKTRKHSKKL